jgi:ppGpp synthetase/RelA/SpoT-type nucleotidyltranferase
MLESTVVCHLLSDYWKMLRMIKDFTDVDISIKEEYKETKNRLFFVCPQ